MKITVCGVAGTTGSAVARRLAALGHDVCGLVRRGSHGTLPETGGRLSLRAVDLNDLDSLEGVFRGADAAYLMVPAFEGMEELGLRLHRAAERAGIDYVVRLSILGGLIERGVGLGLAHGRLDRDLGQRQFQSTVLRPNGFMQNYLWQAAAMAQGTIYTSNGSGRAAIVDVEDIARCVASAIETRVEGVHDLTGPESLTNVDVAATLSEELGWPIRAVTVPTADSVSGMLEAGLPAWLVDRLTEIQRATEAGVGAPTTRAIEDLTGSPGGSFKNFVRRERERLAEGRESGSR